MNFSDIYLLGCACFESGDSILNQPNTKEYASQDMDSSIAPSTDQVKLQLIAMHYNLGCSLQEEGKLEDAIVCYKNVLSIDEKHSDSQYNLANALQLLNKIDEATIEYEKSLILNPRNNLAYYNLGYIYYNNLNNVTKGIEMFNKCLEIEPNDIDAQINIALAYNDLGEMNNVISSYQNIIKGKPDCVIAHFNLGNAFLDAGRCQDGLACFQVWTCCVVL